LIFGTLLCHTKVQIKFFFSLLTDIHSIFGTLLCHTKLQIKFEFGFDQLIFPEVMAHGLEKYYEFSFFCTFVVPPTGFAVPDSYK
jgi:hypothetical protein